MTWNDSASENLAAIQSFHSVTIDIETDYPQFVSDSVSFGNYSTSRMIKVLVAQSDTDLRTLYGDFLKSIDVQCEVTSNGFDCVDRLEQTKNGFDMVLLDANIDGLSCVKSQER